MLSEEAILEFKEIYKRVYKVEITYIEAKEMAHKLISFYIALIGTNK